MTLKDAFDGLPDSAFSFDRDVIYRLAAYLLQEAKGETTVDYDDAGHVVGRAGADHTLWEMLGNVSHISYDLWGVYLSAIVQSWSKNRAGNGLFDVVEAKEKKPVTDKMAVWIDSVNRVFDWAKGIEP